MNVTVVVGEVVVVGVDVVFSSSSSMSEGSIMSVVERLIVGLEEGGDVDVDVVVMAIRVSV